MEATNIVTCHQSGLLLNCLTERTFKMSLMMMMMMMMMMITLIAAIKKNLR